MKRDLFFLIFTGVLFGAMVVFFTCLPRSRYSELERRELARPPQLTFENLKSGQYMADVSHWFSDTEPHRDRFMEAHLQLKDMLAWHPATQEETVKFHGPAVVQAEVPEVHVPTDAELEAEERSFGEYDYEGEDDGVAKIANAGIIVTGDGDSVRAMMVYGGSATGDSPFAQTANTYAERLGDSVQVYAMAIPTSIEFYCPRSVRKHTQSEGAAIANMYSQLSDKVHAVDVYTPLGEHASEDIYLRTDHHWAPLGAYYAAQKFAKVARTDFRPISRYNRETVRNYVGTMYGYSKDISVRNAPEDFVYYTPRDSAYETTYIDYRLDSLYNVAGESKPYKGKFFYKFKDGSSAAYQTFMGGDQKFVHVHTDAGNGRRLVIIKDSFGNALPGYLFGSFEDIYVVDFRYYTHDLGAMIRENGITDVLIALNVFNANSRGVSRKIANLLH